MPDDRAELTRISELLAAAIRDRDRRALDAVLHADFVQISEAGVRTGRDAFLAAVMSGDFLIKEISFDFLSVDVFGDAAVACGVQRAAVQLANGEGVIGRTAFTDVFVKNAGRWLLRVATSADLP